VLGDEEACGQRLGEEASTKMLFPMMLMFIAVILIVATPAVLTLTAACDWHVIYIISLYKNLYFLQLLG